MDRWLWGLAVKSPHYSGEKCLVILRENYDGTRLIAVYDEIMNVFTESYSRIEIICEFDFIFS